VLESKQRLILSITPVVAVEQVLQQKALVVMEVVVIAELFHLLHLRLLELPIKEVAVVAVQILEPTVRMVDRAL
jgi:hypothetical protein